MNYKGKKASATRERGIVTGHQIVSLMLERRRVPKSIEGLSISASVDDNHNYVYVVVNFLSQVIFIFPLFFSMVMNANDFGTKEKQIKIT